MQRLIAARSAMLALACCVVALPASGQQPPDQRRMVMYCMGVTDAQLALNRPRECFPTEERKSCEARLQMLEFERKDAEFRRDRFRALIAAQPGLSADIGKTLYDTGRKDQDLCLKGTADRSGWTYTECLPRCGRPRTPDCDACYREKQPPACNAIEQCRDLSRFSF